MNRYHERFRPRRPRGWQALALSLLTALSAACGNDGQASQGPATGAEPGGGRFQGPGNGAGGAARATPVSVRLAAAGDLEVTLRVSTTLQASARVDVVPKQAGVLARLLVEEGARVAEGQLLAQLDDAEWRFQAQTAEARAQAARDALARGEVLRQQDVIPEQELERLRFDAEVTEADMGLARLRVENAGIRAPIAGTVTHRFVERGQQVGTGTVLFSIANLDRLEAQLAVPEREAHRVVVGQIARILVDEAGTPAAEGRVERIRPVVDPGSGTVQVTVSLSGAAADLLRPGQFVNVDLVTEVLSDRVTLPRTAVRVDGSVPRVFVVQDGRAEEREVVLGYSRGDRVEIRSGIESGDSVVVVGQDNLRPDATVRIMEIDGRPATASSVAGPGR